MALAELEDWYWFDAFYPGYDFFNSNLRPWTKSLAKAKKRPVEIQGAALFGQPPVG